MGLLLDTTKHPFDSASILNWMLWKWGEDWDNGLIVITSRGDGELLAARVRTQLSLIRARIKKEKGKVIREFGLRHLVMDWTDEQGEEFEAVYFASFQNRRHKMREAFSEAFTKEDSKDQEVMEIMENDNGA